MGIARRGLPFSESVPILPSSACTLFRACVCLHDEHTPQYRHVGKARLQPRWTAGVSWLLELRVLTTRAPQCCFMQLVGQLWSFPSTATAGFTSVLNHGGPADMTAAEEEAASAALSAVM